jgi:hypothetical protein
MGPQDSSTCFIGVYHLLSVFIGVLLFCFSDFLIFESVVP